MARLPFSAEGRSASMVEMSVMALAIGILTGLGGVAFRAVVAAIHNFFFLGEFSLYYDPNVHTPSSWLGPLVILSPIIGGLVVIFLSRLPPADRRGQGVSDIIDAIYYREGRVRSFQAFIKSLAAGIQSGSGGSVARGTLHQPCAMAAYDPSGGGWRLGPRRRLQRATGLNRLRGRADDARDQP